MFKVWNFIVYDFIFTSLILILSQNFFKDLAGKQFDFETFIGSSLITGLLIYLKECLTS